MQWQRPLKILKKFPGVSIVKTVSAMVKAGIEYDNKASVQAKRDNGELPAVNQGLTWGHWYDYPRTIEHKGQHYLRLYPANEFGGMRVDYWLTTPNGQQACDTDTAKQYALTSEFSDKESLDCFTVKLSNLLAFERVVPTLSPHSANWENAPEAFACRD